MKVILALPNSFVDEATPTKHFDCLNVMLCTN